MTSTVICGYSGASWEINSIGQDACQQYAALVGTCQSSFIVGPVIPSSVPYLPATGNAPCSCNVVAYNLAAACGWCQDAIQPTWWATEAQWCGNCTSLAATYDATGLPATVPTASLTIPAWALTTVNVLDLTWSPSRASLIAKPKPTAVGGATTRIGELTTDTGFPTSFGYTYGGTTYNPYGVYGQVAAASGAAVAIGVGVTVGMWALSGIVIALVFFMRQKKRKAWYGPTAALYASGGMSSGQPGLAAAPFLFHNEPNIPGSPNPTTNSLPSYYPARPYPPYQPHPPGPTEPSSNHNTPYQPYSITNPGWEREHVPRSFEEWANVRSGTHEYSPDSTVTVTNPFNTTDLIPSAGAPPQGPPLGAGGYTGNAEVHQGGARSVFVVMPVGAEHDGDGDSAGDDDGGSSKANPEHVRPKEGP